ncbi:cytochrome c nitrite reductase pentaheme subunit [Aeromonas simiae]|uniref:Cytochrome c nitrite reductase pentaheme subunit n=1 Tax=Aeromonas simiae TaxID=218936 RepID=A0A5J6X307_9GAMM|nr:cytochrome c nitrite reductase pentaheme subunit [Aeromonas simiae]QFI56638.1 cytochrome c nitrite reductase pentaheme subunit [Aeromonas simiae]
MKRLNLRLIGLVMLAATPLVQANEPPAQSEALPQRSPDYACTQCHQQEREAMHGKHALATNPNNLGPVTCTHCHGKPSPQHREGVKDVMRFHHSLDEMPGEMAFPIAEQNGVCLSCHEPKPLREALWAHDVHATKLTCTSCHALHQAKEPMVGLSDKARIGLCVDCHGKQHAKKLAMGKEAP